MLTLIWMIFFDYPDPEGRISLMVNENGVAVAEEDMYLP
jgi:hypothetical protein